jgi:protein TonB
MPWLFLRKHAPKLLAAGLGVLALLMLYLVKNWLGGEPVKHVSRVQQISVMPPPPPPKIEEKPPEIKRETVQEPVPQPQNDNPPPGENLGVDAEGTGGDSFGLVGRKGGLGLLDGGPFGSYKNGLRADMLEYLRNYRKARRTSYTIVLHLWIARDGRVERVEMKSATGVADLDATLRLALADFKKVREPPPLEMPQPVVLRLTSSL